MDFISILKRNIPLDRPGRVSDLPGYLLDFFGNDLFRRIVPTWGSQAKNSQTYYNNEELWEAILYGQLWQTRKVILKKFCAMEWLPASPGRYFTVEAASHRSVAHNFVNQPRSEYLPGAKLSMIEGGIGSVRLAPYNDKHYLCASSNAISHEGMPLILSKSTYYNLISEIKKLGFVRGDIYGTVEVIPHDQPMVSYSKEVPKYAVSVDDFVFSSNNDIEPRATVASVFTHEIDFGERSSYMYTYKTFDPSNDDAELKSTVEWIEDYAMRYLQTDKIFFLSDFDQIKKHFSMPVDLGISDLMTGQLDPRNLHIKNVKIMGDKITGNNGPVFSKNTGPINFTWSVSVENTFRQRYGQDMVNDLEKAAKIIKDAEHQEAMELLQFFKRELDKEKPNPSVLKNIWDGILLYVPLIESGINLLEKALPVLSNFPGL